MRVNQYTYVRAVAVLNNGETHMVANFVKAQGGCSAPLGSDFKAALAQMGTIKFRALGEPDAGGARLGQLRQRVALHIAAQLARVLLKLPPRCEKRIAQCHVHILVVRMNNCDRLSLTARST